MNANEFTYAQCYAIINVAKWLDMNVDDVAKTYGKFSKIRGGGIWNKKPEDEKIHIPNPLTGRI